MKFPGQQVALAAAAALAKAGLGTGAAVRVKNCTFSTGSIVPSMKHHLLGARSFCR